MIDMKPKDAIQLDAVSLGKTYPEETELLSRMDYIDIFINLANKIDI